MAYFGKTYIEAQRTTLVEYTYLQRSHALKRQEERQRIHELAWKSWEVQGTKSVGSKTVPLYTNFKDFYDTEEEYFRALYGTEYYEAKIRKQKEEKINSMLEANKRLTKSIRKQDSSNDDIAEQNRRIDELLGV